MKKKHQAVFAAAAIFAFALIAACNNTGSGSAKPEGDGRAPESSFMELKYATGFSVEYLENGVKIVTDAENQKFLLVPRGQEAPSGYEDMTVLAIPLQKAVFGSTTHVGMIAPFDVWDCVAGITSAQGTNPEMDKDIAESGCDIKYLGSWSAPDYELMQLINPDLVFVYTGTSALTELIAMLESLGIPYAVNNEYMEARHEGRMEWQLFFAPFFGIDDEAVKYVSEQFAKLDEMNAVIANVVDKPKIAYGSIYQGTVYVSGPDSFVANQVRAAGGEFLHETPGQLSFEEFFDTLANADLWILSMNENSVANYNALLAMVPVLEDSQVVVDKKIWQFHVGYWYFTDQLADQVLDLAAIFHPGLFPGREPFHYHPLAE
ncbi:MAG: ABC transporter substrate-binding protein [Eubacteriaceae bacterium]|nr:ABC transporter substrate-binding protein [Eubacteriaceae bacterium]